MSVEFNQCQDIPSLLSLAARQWPDQIACSSLGGSLTYQQLNQMADAFASFIQQETDLKPGDRIAIQLPNLMQYPVVLFGALRAGLVVVNTNPLYSPPEMQRQFENSGARALVIFSGVQDKLAGLKHRTHLAYVIRVRPADLHGWLRRWVIHSVFRYVRKAEPEVTQHGVLSFSDIMRRYQGRRPKSVSRLVDDLALLQYTGGTTGIPKGAMLSHRNILSNVAQCAERMSAAPVGWCGCVISPLPLYHIYAFMMLLIVLSEGGRAVLIPNPRDLKGFVKQLSRLNITTFIGLNTLFVALSRYPSFTQLDFSSLKLTISGGMPLTKATAQRWTELTAAPILEGYGLTEASPVVAMNDPLNPHLGTVGRALPDTQVMLLSLDDSSQAGEGELCVKGPQVMSGYWHSAEETQAVFTNEGFLRTGDIAKIDSEGLIRIVDRAKDMINVSGFKVYPTEIEDIVCEHPDVDECAVVGVMDDESGEAVKLFVILDKRLVSDRELIRWCKDRMAAYKIPKVIERVDTLPKTPVGKVLRRALKS